MNYILDQMVLYTASFHKLSIYWYFFLGGLVFCIEYLLENSDWLREKLGKPQSAECHGILCNCSKL